MTASPLYRVQRIVSGGQRGVDRGALDAAIALGIDHGGWCPRGRLAENGPIPANYRLQETASAEYAVRTQANVLESDGTLILHRGALGGGTELTRRLARQHGKPHLLIDLSNGAVGGADDVATVHRWLAEQAISVLNVAGPRESTAEGIELQARQFIATVLGDRS